MHLIYFDESKFHEHQSPYFFLGGILIPEPEVSRLETELTQIQYNYFQTQVLNKDTEFHGTHIFDGKGVFKKDRNNLQRRIKLLSDLLACLQKHKVAFKVIRIDVPAHRKKYQHPEPEYHLGLMLFLERCCDYLDQHNALGLVHGDYEQDQIARSVLDFSQFKTTTKTRYYRGRPLGQLVDTIYATHSHYSRFLQLADVALFICQRYESGQPRLAHHDQLLKMEWDKFKNSGDYFIQNWP